MMEVKEIKERKLKKIEDEVWKPIIGSENKYFISNYGRIKSYVHDKVNGKLMHYSQIKGFYTINLRLYGKQKTYLVHKLTAALYVPKQSDECTHVIHLDWNPKNNYYKNLEWVTREVSYLRVSNHLREKK